MPNKILNKKNPIILGIDPGYERLGIALLETNNNKQKLLYSECFQTNKDLSHPERLGLIGEKIVNILKKYSPSKLAIEELIFNKNVKTALKVAEARGVIISETAKLKIPVFELNPNSIKLAITGYGKSDKKQIKSMLERLVEIKDSKKLDDEYDAIAVAMTLAVTSYPQ